MSCATLPTLSRFVILTYMKYGHHLTPMTERLKGRLDVVPTFLFLKPQHLLASLDSLSPTPTTIHAPLDHGLDLLSPSRGFSIVMSDLYAESSTLIARASLLGQGMAMRGPSKKRSAREDVLEEEHGGVHPRKK
jgi:hypothetical protein